MPHSPIAIANEFIRRAVKDGHGLDQMQLQKLVYIAHGWNLAVNGEPLVDEAPIAAPYGISFPSLSAALVSYGSDKIKTEITRKES